MKGTEYRGVTSVDGPIVILKRTENVFYNETVCVRDRFGEKRIGKIVDIVITDLFLRLLTVWAPETSGFQKDSYLKLNRNFAHKIPACKSIRQNYPKKRKINLFFG